MAENTPQTAARPALWLMPSVAQWVWLVVLVVLLGAPWRTAMVASDGDACMHWRVGESMLQSRHVIRADVFSCTRYGQPIYSKEWLAEIVFAIAGRMAGLTGLSVLAAVLIATTFMLLYRQLARDGADIFVAVMVVILAAWASCMHWLARPHVFSFLLMVIWNGALRSFERTGRFQPMAITLAGLTLLWVNLHGGYLAGFIVLGAYGLAGLIERNRPKVWALIQAGLLCAAVALVNPNGWRLHLHNIQFLRSDFFANYLAEYQSPDFHSGLTIGFVVWLGAIFLVLVLRRPRVPASEGILLLVWTHFALFAARNIPLLVVVTAPLLARTLSECVPGRWRALGERFQTLDAVTRGWAIVGAAGLALIAFVPRDTAMPAGRWPVAAVQYIEERPAAFAGNMLNQYAWGGYLMWILPDHKVFVDGRADFYGEGLVKEFQQTTALRPNWIDALQKYNVTWTLMPSDHRLNQALALLPQEWSCLYSDKVATIYGRVP